MQDRVKKYIEKEKLIKQGDSVIVGVSGGPDSMALLHLLKQLTAPLNFSIIAAHVNHQLRKESDKEEDFVRVCCLTWQVPFYCQRFDIREEAQRGKKTLEEAGRDCRYRYFNELLRLTGSSLIATAHHQGDNAETVLLHLLRGSGIRGLRGIMPRNGSLIRPLLCIGRSDIIKYLNENRIPYCTDESNYDCSFLRNRIRHELIPYIANEYNPNIIERLNQLAQIAREENDVIEKETAVQWDRVVIKQESEQIVFNLSDFFPLHAAYQKRLILKALGCIKGEGGWSASDVLLIEELLKKEGSSKYVKLKKGVIVRKTYDKLLFNTVHIPKISFCYEFAALPARINIAETGESYIFKVLDRGQFLCQPGDLYLDYDLLKGPFCIRSRRPGDIFHPLGMVGRKKIKDYFIDLKVPAEERDKVPLLISRGAICAVFGYTVSQIVAVNSNTRRIVVIQKENAV
jgi:tRNA(Ile)-lysidine synthase